MATTNLVHLSRVAPVYRALRQRAQATNVPTARFHEACQRALRLLDEGRSNGLAIAEGLKAMRPLRALDDSTPGGVG